MSELWRLRHFCGSLVWRDLNSHYRGSILGLGWTLVHPIAMAVVLCLVFQALFGITIREFAPRLLVGLSIWMFIATCASGGCRAFLQNSAFLKQKSGIRGVFPLRVVGAATVNLAITLVIGILANVVLNGWQALLGLLWVPLVAIALIWLGWMSAIISAHVHTYFRDFAHILDISLQGMFYLSPIIYPLEMLEGRGIAWVVKWNPLSAVVEGLRAPLLHIELPSASTYLVLFSFGIVLTVLAFVCSRRLGDSVIFRL
ncbi:ABC transporter permease [Calycomorphotria hydatis]|uniref:Transport permease protein n=1 Tax=Calycomorphotria hydatis TaxID=2528027 RepID=A0A517T7D0_9PLAN|nr:ABC-2 type transporter [Calycomorphotria hydatis]